MKKRKWGLLVTMCFAFALLFVGVIASKTQIKSNAAFNSKRISIRKCQVVLDREAYSLNTEAVTPEVTVTYNGETLVKDIDYKVSYTNNEGPGEGYAKVKGMGNYKGSKTLRFFISGVDLESECTFEVDEVTKKLKVFHNGYELNPISYEVNTEELTYAEKNEDGSVASYVTQIKYIVTSRSNYYDGIATYIYEYSETPEAIQ